jgi:hypothetical protein
LGIGFESGTAVEGAARKPPDCVCKPRRKATVAFFSSGVWADDDATQNNVPKRI